MSNVVIKVEDLSKQYRLGQVSTGTISHDVNRWWHKVRGKEDPYLKVGEANDRTTAGSSEYVWALRDINFEVKQGEVLGIIGRNGAGKSTLLKLLSRTTAPTTGSIKIKGRVASLLEVGTGFHPELSGRENIFLNGAILGMTKQEIKSKFDEIVDFAGIERYIDTPVKRYSSGMYVRLAFAVAAHLEPEILIVDEVLAVGDAEFQKKCIGKMKDVSEKDGRTVLFVSHNMQAVQALCTHAVLMHNGAINSEGGVQEIVKRYYKINQEQSQHYYFSKSGYITRIEISNDKKNDFFDINESVNVEIDLSGVSGKRNMMVSLDLLSASGIIVNSSRYYIKNTNSKDLVNLMTKIPASLLNNAEYVFSVYLIEEGNILLQSLPEVLHFEIQEKRQEAYMGNINGVVRVGYEWTER